MTNTARDANMLRLEDFVMRALYVDPDELDPGGRRILRERVERHVAAALANPSLVLAALVEAHGLDACLEAMGGRVGTYPSSPDDDSGMCAAWRFPTKETTDG